MSSNGEKHRGVTVKVTSNKPPTSALTPAPPAPAPVQKSIMGTGKFKKPANEYDAKKYQQKRDAKLGTRGRLLMKMKLVAYKATKSVISAPVRKRALGL